MSRNKKLRKGIESLIAQREKHKEKMEAAKAIGNEKLAGYYAKEMEGIRLQEERKRRMLKLRAKL